VGLRPTAPPGSARTRQGGGAPGPSPPAPPTQSGRTSGQARARLAWPPGGGQGQPGQGSSSQASQARQQLPATKPSYVNAPPKILQRVYFDICICGQAWRGGGPRPGRGGPGQRRPPWGRGPGATSQRRMRLLVSPTDPAPPPLDLNQFSINGKPNRIRLPINNKR